MSRKAVCLLSALMIGSLFTACNQEAKEQNIAIARITEAPVMVTEMPVVTVVPTQAPTPEPTLVPTPIPTATPTPTPKDTLPPVIEGAQDIIIYLGDTVSYRKGVTVSDDSGEVPGLEIDNSQVNLTAAGSYPVIYQATDSSGNTASVEIVLQVLEKPTVEELEVKELAAQIVAKQVTQDMTEYDKVYALYKWCRKNIRYSYTAGDRTSIWTGAYEGLHDKVGDCYAYYAAYAVLLDSCGIENMCVTRVSENSNHWWNLVKVDGGWYHCDASPRTLGDKYRCFLQTDEQVLAYTESNTVKPDYYAFDTTLYPQRATEILFGKSPEQIKTERQAFERQGQ